MYLSMVNLHIKSRFYYGKSKWPSYFVVNFGLVGRLGLGVGVKTSLVTNSENEIVLTTP